MTSTQMRFPQARMREPLTADRTYYVRTDGNDSNTGLANTALGAFLTVQKAIDTAAALDLGLYNVIIQLADGTYTGLVTPKSFVGAGSITIQGNLATPSNVVINGGTGSLITADCVKGLWVLKDFKLAGSPSATVGIIAKNGTILNIGNLVFGTGFGVAHIMVQDFASVVVLSGYTVAAGAQSHWNVSGGVLRCQSMTITFSGSPNFTTAVTLASRPGYIIAGGNTFSGTVTGTKYSITLNAVVDTGGSLNLPGTAATGSTATGGQYS